MTRFIVLALPHLLEEDPINFCKCSNNTSHSFIGRHQFHRTNKFCLDDRLLHVLFMENSFALWVSTNSTAKGAFAQSTHCCRQVYAHFHALTLFLIPLLFASLSHQVCFYTCRFSSIHQSRQVCK